MSLLLPLLVFLSVTARFSAEQLSEKQRQLFAVSLRPAKFRSRMFTTSFYNSTKPLPSSIAAIMSHLQEFPARPYQTQHSPSTNRDVSVKLTLNPCASPFHPQSCSPSTDRQTSVKRTALDPCASPFYPPNTFTLFPILPIELRLKIWKVDLPPARVNSFRTGGGPAPGVLSLCQKSRKEIRDMYHMENIVQGCHTIFGVL